MEFADDPLAAFHAAGDVVPRAVLSRAFGAPCFKVGTRVFAWFVDEEMVFRLSADDATDALSCAGARLFDPSGKGRPMKSWVRVPFDCAEEWPHFAVRAAAALPPGDTAEDDG